MRIISVEIVEKWNVLVINGIQSSGNVLDKNPNQGPYYHFDAEP